MATPRGLISFDRGLIAPLTTAISVFNHYGRMSFPPGNLWNPSIQPKVSITTSGYKS